VCHGPVATVSWALVHDELSALIPKVDISASKVSKYPFVNVARCNMGVWAPPVSKMQHHGRGTGKLSVASKAFDNFGKMHNAMHLEIVYCIEVPATASAYQVHRSEMLCDRVCGLEPSAASRAGWMPWAIPYMLPFSIACDESSIA